MSDYKAQGVSFFRLQLATAAPIVPSSCLAACGREGGLIPATQPRRRWEINPWSNESACVNLMIAEEFSVAAFCR